ncbi:MAG: hypothetical protein H0T79_22345, partial [Deltaproteobacteria bacterium]|nr:hypothetical protein [Deltaproteobacteria bacterium]
LTLRVLTLSDDEKVKIRELDPRARAILERCERLDADQLAKMHGAIRRLDRGGRDPRSGLGPGDRVRLEPSPLNAHTRNDAIDVVLAGMLATVLCVEQDLEGRVMVAVAIDDDPGRDLGVAGKIGHRFFFRPDELRPLTTPGAG